MSEAVLTRRSLVKEGYELIADIEVSGSAVTELEITGLNINPGDIVLLVAFAIMEETTCPIFLFVNGNNVSTNYTEQEIVVSGTSIYKGRYSGPIILYGGSLNELLSFVELTISNNGRFVYDATMAKEVGTGNLHIQAISCASHFTISTITSLLLQATVTGAIGVGSRVQLYKAGE